MGNGRMRKFPSLLVVVVVTGYLLSSCAQSNGVFSSGPLAQKSLIRAASSTLQQRAYVVQMTSKQSGVSIPQRIVQAFKSKTLQLVYRAPARKELLSPTSIPLQIQIGNDEYTYDLSRMRRDRWFLVTNGTSENNLLTEPAAALRFILRAHNVSHVGDRFETHETFMQLNTELTPWLVSSGTV